ncbi:BTAD domain-containing putative transcriptional regulator [Actinosynnema sp. NPDC047251]|uniref:Transcriptional regulator, SARP family, fused with ATPase domain n=1 Tax=Saccharothrix espanaensis (strain ATCC 51144 / DSM 44229 / JCM 9112 / NBRC 15066 / NRRL 15764) TaxID=1179773 RepID=K0JXZ1_SACES|nr:BTAD domain-containing putative transcriptional regulator [Saccharothrix espanaensis]CCH31006.1 Transcriptional regulator, SARP family, fused with ATPase domain [Saccharothrix espanaensis DSM 44229]
MRFGVLGPVQVRSADGAVVPVGGPRPRAVLVLLLLTPGRVVSLDRLVEGQYGDDPPAQAGNAVQAQVSRLRRALPGGLVEFSGNGYRIAVDPDDVDAHVFERLARDGRALLAAGRLTDAAEVLREALGLWRGAALVDLPHGDAQAARFEELRLVATEDLVDAELASPDGTQVARLRALVAAHPLRERFREQLVRALHEEGRTAEALAEFEDARRLLADELGADPAPGLAAAHLAVLRAEEPRTRRGLPARLTSFVGRDAELDRLAGTEARLVTVFGPGGTGKTRLAVEFATRAGGAACFADLSNVDSPDAVPLAVLAASGLREPGSRPGRTDPVDRLVAAFDQDLLLVLDNCEHVVGAVAALAHTLLARCARLRVLATSREPLGLTGETLLSLEPLAASTADDPAVRLFADRAAAVRPGFVVDADNADAVVAICAAVDGLPLAIELAAARLRQFGVAEIAGRLAGHGRFRLLSRGDRTAAERHRTLHAVVAWSWDLLGDRERVLARRFSVFAGASLAAVEEVCGVEDADEVLADLVDRSLVTVVDGRYRMSETIRLFCAQHLDETEERDVRRAHAAYYLALAQRADPHLRGAEQLTWLARLSAEHDNLMTALRHADRETGMRLVAALAAYWWLGGRRAQAGEVAAALLVGEIPDGLAEEYVSCVVHAWPRPAADHWERARRIVESGGLGRLRYPFGVALWGMVAGPPENPHADPGGLLGDDPWNLALGLFSEALIAVLDRGAAEGERGMLKALAAFRALGERWGAAQSLDWLAQDASWRGEWSLAHDRWAEALAMYELLGTTEECAELLCHRGRCLLRQGDPDGARAEFGRAAALFGRPAAESLLGLGEVARLTGDRDAAAGLLAAALAADEGGAWRTARTWTALARLADDPDEKAELHSRALRAARSPMLGAEFAAAVEGRAEVEPAGRAALLLGVAVALRGTARVGDPDVARVADAARAEIGAEAFAAAYARGAAMSRNQALTTVGA